MQRHKSNNFTLVSTDDSIYIKLGKDELNSTLCNQSFTEKDTNYFAIMNGRENCLYLYNLDKQSLSKKIVIQKEGVNALPYFKSFYFINRDSILIQTVWPNIIAIVNENGEILKKVAMEKDIHGKYLRPANGYYNSKLSYNDSILYLFQVWKGDDYSGVFTSKFREQSEITIAVNIKTGTVKSLPLKYPKELVNKDIFNQDEVWEKGYNCYVYLSAVEPIFFVTNNFLNFKTYPIKTNIALDLPNNMMRFSSDINGLMEYLKTKDNLKFLVFDKYRKLYYLIVQKKNERKGPVMRSDFLFPNCFIAIFDVDFKHKGDVDFPDNISMSFS